MSKELPYFQFEPAEYLAGDIQECSLEAQGLFINIISLYWQRGCVLSMDRINRRYSNNPLEVQELFDNEIMVYYVEERVIRIPFLDEQYHKLTLRKKQLSDAGKKGYKAKQRQANVKPPLSKAQATLKQPEEKRREEKIYRELDKSKIDIFNKWFKYRKEIKKPIASETTLKTLIKKFNAEGLDKCEYIVNSSIENSWQGLFWDKYVETTQQKSRDQKQLEYIKAQIKKSDVSE